MKNYIGLTFREFVENKVLYHGSDSDNIKEIINNKSLGYFGNGFYLSSNLEIAKKNGKNIYLIKAPLNNCAEVSVFRNYKKVIFHRDSERADKAAGGHKRWILDEEGYNKVFTSLLYSRGYDGIRLHIDKNKDAEVLIFNPRNLIIVDKM